ncbi:MAG: hypothetical protein ACOH2V_00855 [Candidatus Saccharimonadaceae bacterium]
MTQEEQQELLILNTVLSDRLFFENYKRKDNELLGIMVNRHTVLLDKVINHYKLPMSSLTTP